MTSPGKADGPSTVSDSLVARTRASTDDTRRSTAVLWAFARPAARTVATAATAQVKKQLEQRKPAFEIHRYADEAAARDAIEDRTVYGAVVVAPEGPELAVACAAAAGDGLAGVHRGHADPYGGRRGRPGDRPCPDPHLVGPARPERRARRRAEPGPRR